MLQKIRGTSDECVEKIKLLLPIIGDIKGFSVYSDEFLPSKYKQIPEVSMYEGKIRHIESSYNLILRCSTDNPEEIWIESSNCGYSGSGPSATNQILQLLGVRNFNYEDIRKKKFIVEENVKAHHDLNFIVYKEDESEEWEKILVVKMKFDKASNKWNSKDKLKVIGYFNPLDEVDYKLEKRYFKLPYDTEHEWNEYKTNNSFTLHKHFTNISMEDLEKSIKEIAYRSNVRNIDIERI